MTKKTFFMDGAVWKRLLAIAKRDGTGVSELIRRAIIEFLRKEEKRGETL